MLSVSSGILPLTCTFRVPGGFAASCAALTGQSHYQSGEKHLAAVINPLPASSGCGSRVCPSRQDQKIPPARRSAVRDSRNRSGDDNRPRWPPAAAAQVTPAAAGPRGHMAKITGVPLGDGRVPMLHRKVVHGFV